MRSTLFCILALCPLVAAAGDFTISPVRIFMSIRDRAVALEVRNTGAAPVTLRAELNVWTQSAAGEDQLTPTDDVVLSPPVVKLAPGARQVVRLVRLVPNNPAKQHTYRMLLREVRAPGEATGRLGMNIQLVLSIPVFVTPPKVQRELECSAGARSPDAVQFTCANGGDAYAQIVGATVTQAGRPVANFTGPVYLLPGTARTLKANGAGVPGKAELEIRFDDRQARTISVVLP